MQNKLVPKVSRQAISNLSPRLLELNHLEQRIYREKETASSKSLEHIEKQLATVTPLRNLEECSSSGDQETQLLI